jgi:hypothetical protein
MDIKKNREKAEAYWLNLTDYEMAQIREFRASAGVNYVDKKEAYITIDKPIKGYCDLLVSWSDSFEGHLPYQMGYFGYQTESEALSVALDSAVELEVPLDYVREDGRHIYM